MEGGMRHVAAVDAEGLAERGGFACADWKEPPRGVLGMFRGLLREHGVPLRFRTCAGGGAIQVRLGLRGSVGAVLSPDEDPGEVLRVLDCALGDLGMQVVTADTGDVQDSYLFAVEERERPLVLCGACAAAARP
jgi:hypothetical protein